MKGSIRLVRAALALGVLVFCADGAVADAPGAADAVKARQAHFKEQGKAFKTITDQLKSGAPDKAEVGAAAQKLDTLATDLPNWFPKGSGPEAGVPTKAKPEIWAQPDAFAKDAANLRTEADKLAQVAASGDVAALGAQVKATGDSCGTCHKSFKLKGD